MSLWEVINEQVAVWKDSLAESAFTWESMYGLILFLLLVGIGVFICKKLGRAIVTGFMLMIFLQICYLIAHTTPIGVQFPILRDLFKYQPLIAFAQMTMGTPLADAFLWLQSFLNQVTSVAFTLIWMVVTKVWSMIWHSFQILSN